MTLPNELYMHKRDTVWERSKNFFLCVLDRFDALISKMILKKIILMHFGMKKHFEKQL
jgi:hypothetical protein